MSIPIAPEFLQYFNLMSKPIGTVIFITTIPESLHYDVISNQIKSKGK